MADTDVSIGKGRGGLRMVRAGLGSAVYAGLALVAGGRLDWARGWIYVILFAAVSVAGTLIVERANPGLLEARAKGFRKDTKRFDRVFYAVFLPLAVVYPMLGGLDAARFGWAPLPWWTVLPGVLLFVAGSALSTWTLIVNRHAESTVRIQNDRGHVVVSDGPYRVVRHPMYTGTVIGLPAAALVLGSGWALVPMALIVVAFIVRTAFEDRALRRELPGYEAYAGATRYRLVPGLW
jgi:protein-S-isoprenylcysteine O-methyltransferase Ste14